MSVALGIAKNKNYIPNYFFQITFEGALSQVIIMPQITSKRLRKVI